MVLPHVVLHDHLDGGLRIDTMLELADRIGHRLPRTDPVALADAFDQRESGSLEGYLEAFTHTVALMQTEEALARVAHEALTDLSAGGAVHAEIRFAPMLATAGGLRPEAVMEAVLDGLARAGGETKTSWGFIVDAMRQHHDSETVAALAVRYQDRGVVAFDLAGPEAGFPPDDHLPAIRTAHEHGLGVTLHAGEAAGVASVATAVNRCHADRIGHGIEVVDDMDVVDGEVRSVGRVAALVRDRRIPLEVCPTSNLATKQWRPEQHPVGILHRAGFTVTLNTDNRLMSNTSMADEMDFVRHHHGFGIDDLATVTRRALVAAYVGEAARRHVWDTVVAPAYREAGARVSDWW